MAYAFPSYAPWTPNSLPPLFVILLLTLNRGLGNSVEISHTGLGDSAPTPSTGAFIILIKLFQNTQLLQGLHDLAVD